ncbi:MAG: DUF4785 family immunoglobulin-like domain-containing protein [Polyangiales bacterium]
MKHLGSLVFIASSVLLAACSNNTPPEPTPAPTPAQSDAVQLGAGLHPGDVYPAALQPRANLVMPPGLVTVSQPLPPGGSVTGEETTPAAVASTDALKIASKGTTELTQTIPVDSTQGEAVLFLSPQVDSPTEISKVLQGITVLDPAGKVINIRESKHFTASADMAPMTMVSLANKPIGTYTFKLSEYAAKSGVALDVRQPGSSIVMRMRPSTYEHLLGSDADTVDLSLGAGTDTISGATINATLLDPELKPVRPIAFKEVRPGFYQAKLDAGALNAADKIGAYLVDIKAEGTTPTGVKFLRTGRTGFHFGVPTARIVDVSSTRMLKDAAGLVNAFEIDVTLESSATDRLELSATLAAKSPDGKERPVMIAFTGDTWEAGKRTVTLRFDAGNAKLTHVEGAYEIRNLKLFSLGTNTLFQRIGVVPTLKFAPVTMAQIAPLKVISPGVQQLIDEGTLFKD